MTFQEFAEKHLTPPELERYKKNLRGDVGNRTCSCCGQCVIFSSFSGNWSPEGALYWENIACRSMQYPITG